MSQPRAFRKGQRLQAGSQLVQLPAELLQKVLRCLLRCEDGRIRSRRELRHSQLGNVDEDDSAEEKKAQVKLYQSFSVGGGQILSTCQKLYHEGKAILYEQQSIEIMVCWKGWALQFAMLNKVISMNDPKMSGHDFLVDHDDIVYCEDAISPTNLSALLSDFVLVTKQFSSITVIVRNEHFDRIDAFMTCRALQPMTKDQKVTMRFVHDATSHTVQQVWLNHLPMLDACAITMQIRNVSGSQEETGSGCVKRTADIYQLWREFKEDFLDKLPLNKKYSTFLHKTYPFNDGHIRMLVEAIIEHDVQAFQLNRAAVMKAAIKWIEERREEKLQELAEQMKSTSSKAGLAIAEIQSQLEEEHPKPYFEGLDLNSWV